MPTVDDVMLTVVKTCDAATTVGEIRAMFSGGHVHAALVLDAGRLACVIDRDDLSDELADARPAAEVGRLDGRTVATGTPLEQALRTLEHQGRRRLAVVTGDGRLLGLLCLKRHGRGFCRDADVLDRDRERTQACAP